MTYSDPTHQLLNRIANQLERIANALERQPEQKKPRQKRSEKVTDPNFNAFWDLFPRKVGRPAALRAWNGLNQSQRHKALEVVPRWKDSWRNTDIQFIPHASTWLNQHRFFDDIEQAVPQQELLPSTEQGWLDYGKERGIEPGIGESMNAYITRLKTA